MTAQETINYYANLLILQYRGRPKAYATVQAFADLMVADLIVPQVRDGFNIANAIGVQLDTLGKYAGVQRQGYSISGDPITLGDDDFRTFIRIAALTNTSQSTLAEVQNLLKTFFNGKILVFDYQNMQIGYMIDSAVGSYDLAQMILSQGILPKPMGVLMSSTIYNSPITGFFGMRTYESELKNVSPFNTYQNYNQAAPFMDYLFALHAVLPLNTEASEDILNEDGTQIYA